MRSLDDNFRNVRAVRQLGPRVSVHKHAAHSPHLAGLRAVGLADRLEAKAIQQLRDGMVLLRVAAVRLSRREPGQGGQQVSSSQVQTRSAGSACQHV